MGSSLSLRVNPLELPVFFAGVRKNQVPLAASQALNDTVWEAHMDLRTGLHRRFRVRSQRTLTSIQGPPSPGRHRGNSSLASHKKDWPHLSARVAVWDQWLARHEEGGPQKPERNKSFAIPARIVAAKRNKSGAIPESLRPSTLRARGAARRVEQLLVADKLEKRRASSLKGLEVLYLLRRRIRLPARLEGRSTLDRVARKSLHEHFGERLTAALKSERVREGRFTSAQGRFMWLKASGLLKGKGI